MPESKDDKPVRWLTVAQVLKFMPVSKRTLFRMESEGHFPKSFALTQRRHWKESDILQWKKNLSPEQRKALRRVRRRKR